ncbi:MAG: PEP-CTERM sorting domain-containing protein [Pseudomonadota bacterium]
MNIKRLLQVGLILAGSIALPAWAIMIDDSSAGALDGTNVGSLDTFIEEGDTQGNPEAEEDWVNAVLAGDNTTFTVKNTDINYFSTLASDTVFAFELASSPDYFLIKNATRIALFENLMDFDWGVFDSSLLSDGINLPSDGFMISHVSEFGGGHDVPEPGVLGLLGIGLIGIVLGRRRMVA